MVQIDNINIDKNAQSIFIEASITDNDYSKNVTLGSVSIRNHNKAIAAKVFSLNEDKHTIIEIPLISIAPIDVYKDLLIIRVDAFGIPADNTPCGMDTMYKETMVLNCDPYLKRFINSLKAFDSLDDCNKLPMTFIEGYLKFKGLQISMKLNDIDNAIKFYNALQDIKPIVSSNCGCNGRGS